ncbi:MAG: hypothetical protein UFA98_09835 [Ruminococcus sp.]|nr:hypothetical protein [Ruminococcus sp.]
MSKPPISAMIIVPTREILPVFEKPENPVRIEKLDGYEIYIYRMSDCFEYYFFKIFILEKMMMCSMSYLFNTF